MDIRILHLIDGARQAEGLTVVIDVFRAFSLECWLYAMGAGEIRPVSGIEEALSWRKKTTLFLFANIPVCIANAASSRFVLK